MAIYEGKGQLNSHYLEDDFERRLEAERERRAKESGSRRGAEIVTKGPLDLPFLLLTIIILCFGVVMVFSASYASAYYDTGQPAYYFIRQAIFAGIGVAAMLLIANMDYHIFRKIAFPTLLISIVLLMLVPIIGTESNGAKRWISLGFTTFQPSELAKLGVILSFSSMICVYKEKMSTIKYGIVPFVIILGVISGLLALEPHISATVIIWCIGAALMFVGGVKKGWFITGIIVVGVLGWLIITKVGYSSTRIATWRDPFSDTTGTGWQIIQSLYSIGSGGFLGLGLGNSRQKYLYLPEEHNDFIFAVVCEELGWVGAVIIIILFMLLIIRGYWLAMHARDRFGTLVIVGITTLLALQVFFNIAVVTNFIPTTGISLPFFSYGGTALVMQLAEMGMILSVARQNPVMEQ